MPAPLNNMRQLRDMTDEELAAALDAKPTHGWEWTFEQYLLEYRARQAAKQTRTMVCLTMAIAAMTVVSTAFVVLSTLHVVG